MNKLSLFLKDMFLKDNYFQVFLLLFFISLIIIPRLVFGEGIDSGYRINNAIYQEVVHYTGIGTATTSTCLHNRSGELKHSSADYFVPTRTYAEWLKFSDANSLYLIGVDDALNSCSCSACNNDGICNSLCENHTNCPNDCPGATCITNPANGYIGAAYTTSVTQGTTGGGGCVGSDAFGMTGYTVNFTQPSIVYQDPSSGGHTYQTNWYTQCATLFKAPQMCTNNYCVLGLTYPDYSSYSHDPNKLLPHNATFFYGHYDATSGVCVAGDTNGSNGLYTQFVGSSPYIYTAGQLSLLEESYPNQPGLISSARYDTVGSWGSTSNCGDHVCDSSRYENCTNCPIDCGSCSGYCTTNNDCLWNQTCTTSCVKTVICNAPTCNVSSSTCSECNNISGCYWGLVPGLTSTYTCMSSVDCASLTQANCTGVCSWSGTCH